MKQLHAGVALALCVAVLGACSRPLTTREKGTLGGAAIGAGTGAIIGSQTGHAGTGAVIGGALGALGGAVVGDEAQAQEEEQAEQQRRLNEQQREIERQREEIEELQRQQGGGY